MTQELSWSSNGETRAVSITYRRFIDPLLVALFASVTVTIGAANPSFWYDEAATISASNRTLSELAKLVTTTDSAHPFYYLLMNGWFRIVPQTEFWARAPSCIAVGIAAAGL